MKMKKNSLGVILTLALVTGIPTLLAATDNTEKAAPSKYSIASVKGKVPNYPVNEQRQTYGYGPYPYGPTQEPELIKAERENGVVGYVKASDLDSSVSSPEEVITYQESMESSGYNQSPCMNQMVKL
ncbi:hypothetical protein WJ0W_000274 [Paenibacillus melissococcoides]|uniref:Uncharacterized protein n=1 Tax=Paenibacillus melissococcoides TaxID=2912268 RepID=A0ABM9FV89_9BACL|nr:MULTISPECIES: hypothetical protein [Paenibacillus]MEB9892784.1 hypothetical protein [Bacillus cereus]CAH8243065.1 hypothetical protein WJ0W_000274 [Paenibacillus melissococcoides]CAH8703682.1 hypothetical protein WDD9_000269 [Paenibacillus melissococcoides]CAH8706685.1 hypothetical protein HTL2_001353 [Paenibacillus melissococcoides]GIO79093.1 hypothetical protein J6TS7_27030 [Paenibacillus dendritiformis]